MVNFADRRLSAALALVEAQLEASREEMGIPGLAAALVHDREISWSTGLGVMNLSSAEPLSAKTIFRVGSITKVFTATMLMQLRDTGKVHLDDTVDTHIGGFSIQSPFPGSRVPTLLQLASHTSGLPVEAPLEHFHTFVFPTGAEMAASLKGAELGFLPGTRFRYSNAGYAVLGHALEQAAGRPYTEHVTETILRPLGMSDSGFDAPPEVRERMATLYRRGLAGGTLTESFHPDIGGLTPSGHLYSTVLDMARFISLQFSDGSRRENGVLDAGSIAEMRTPVWMSPDWTFGMGTGWGLSRLREHIIVNKSGATFGTTTDAAFIPDLKLGMAIFVNAIAMAPALTRAGLEIVAPVVEQLSRSPAAPAVDAPAEWEMYTGTYIWPAMELLLEIQIVDGRLLAVIDQGLAVERIQLIPSETHRFRLAGGSVDGATATFEVAEDGGVSRLFFGPYLFHRASGKEANRTGGL